jgi:uncharacterized membrane protein YagU involved in acid resistance
MPELSSASAVAPRRNALNAVLCAWVVAGTLDILAAVIYYTNASSAQTIRLLQGIASGVLGDEAFTGGMETAMLGLGLHYSIALIWTLVFFVFLGRLRRPLTNRLVIGLAYGVVIWMVMNLVVLPLSNVRHAPIHLSQAVVGAVILMLCVGLPISIIVGRQNGG